MTEIFKYTKICTYCSEEKGLGEFVRDKGRITTKCHACNNRMAKEHYKKTPLCTNKGSPWFNSLRLNLKVPFVKKEEEDEF